MLHYPFPGIHLISTRFSCFINNQYLHVIFEHPFNMISKWQCRSLTFYNWKVEYQIRTMSINRRANVWNDCEEDFSISFSFRGQKPNIDRNSCGNPSAMSKTDRDEFIRYTWSFRMKCISEKSQWVTRWKGEKPFWKVNAEWTPLGTLAQLRSMSFGYLSSTFR